MTWMIDHADELRAAAAARRNRGLPVGKSAKGWDIKRPDPIDEFEVIRAKYKAIFSDHCRRVLADYHWESFQRAQFDKIPF